MLGKLLKYEFRATARWMLPIYAGVILLSALYSISFAFFKPLRNVFDYEYQNTDILYTLMLSMQNIIMILYVLVLMATFILTFVVMIQRFYKNLLGDEGYLMFTLPVSPSSHILSKLITSSVWYIASFFVAFISFLILPIGPDVIKGISEVISWGFEGHYYEFSQMIQFGIEFLILMFVSIISSALMCYASIAIGSTRKNHRVLYSFLAFFGLNFVTQIILGILTTIVTFFFTNSPAWYESSFEGILPFFHWMLNLGSVSSVVLCVVYYIICHQLLKKKLNLE